MDGRKKDPDSFADLIDFGSRSQKLSKLSLAERQKKLQKEQDEKLNDKDRTHKAYDDSRAWEAFEKPRSWTPVLDVSRGSSPANPISAQQISFPDHDDDPFDLNSSMGNGSKQEPTNANVYDDVLGVLGMPLKPSDEGQPSSTSHLDVHDDVLGPLGKPVDPPIPSRPQSSSSTKANSTPAQSSDDSIHSQRQAYSNNNRDSSIQERKTGRPSVQGNSSLQSPRIKASEPAVQRLRAANLAAEDMDAQRLTLYDTVNARIITWKTGKENNIRALLASLDSVLWESAGWTKVGMHELVADGRVKVTYMKAITKVHPDKIPNNASVEERMIAGAVFSILNEAWNSFRNG